MPNVVEGHRACWGSCQGPTCLGDPKAGEPEIATVCVWMRLGSASEQVQSEKEQAR